jgi:hypothetical protein
MEEIGHQMEEIGQTGGGNRPSGGGNRPTIQYYQQDYQQVINKLIQ